MAGQKVERPIGRNSRRMSVRGSLSCFVSLTILPGALRTSASTALLPSVMEGGGGREESCKGGFVFFFQKKNY